MIMVMTWRITMASRDCASRHITAKPITFIRLSTFLTISRSTARSQTNCVSNSWGSTSPKSKWWEPSSTLSRWQRTTKKTTKSSSKWPLKTKSKNDNLPKASAKCTKWPTFCLTFLVFSKATYTCTTKLSQTLLNKKKSIRSLIFMK